jgi:hypothetical protein
MKIVKGAYLTLTGTTGTHVIRNGLFLVDKWDPVKEGTKQLHEINIENKLECMKRIADIVNLGNDMGELNRGKNISTTQISNNDISWDANFAMLVEYVGKNLLMEEFGFNSQWVFFNTKENSSKDRCRLLSCNCSRCERSHRFIS